MNFAEYGYAVDRKLVCRDEGVDPTDTETLVVERSMLRRRAVLFCFAIWETVCLFYIYCIILFVPNVFLILTFIKLHISIASPQLKYNDTHRRPQKSLL